MEMFDLRDPHVSVAADASSSPRVSHSKLRDGSDTFVAQQRVAGIQPVPDQQRVRSYPANLMSNPRFCHVREYLTGHLQGQRGIRIGVLIKYGVGCAKYR